MSITEKMRKVFDACTVMAGVEPDFECVYMTKGAALLYLDEIDAENAKLRGLVQDYEHCSMHADCGRCEYDGTASTHCPLSPCFPDIDELRDLGVEVD